MSTADLTRLYDDLGRFQWWRRRFSGGSGLDGLAMHKRLRDGGAGLSDLNEWLTGLVGDAEPRSVLDLGAGFGATLFHWAQRWNDTRFCGLSLSPYQVARARSLTSDLGLADRVEFVEADNAHFDPGGRTFDLVVSVETLFHAADLRRTLASAAAFVEPGGRLLLVEDMLASAESTRDSAAAHLSELWSTPTLHTVDDFRDAWTAAGLDLLEEHDLSPHVVWGEPSALASKKARLSRWASRLPLRSAREILRAFEGGVALEELYSKGAMKYLAWIGRK